MKSAENSLTRCEHNVNREVRRKNGVYEKAVSKALEVAFENGDSVEYWQESAMRILAESLEGFEYPFQPVTYLSRLPASCIALQKYHYSPTSCHRQSADTVFRPTRRVMYRSSAGFAESWRSHPAACPFGQRREFPRHPDYSVVKDQTREKRSSHLVEHEKGENIPLAEKT